MECIIIRCLALDLHRLICPQCREMNSVCRHSAEKYEECTQGMGRRLKFRQNLLTARYISTFRSIYLHAVHIRIRICRRAVCNEYRCIH